MPLILYRILFLSLSLSISLFIFSFASFPLVAFFLQQDNDCHFRAAQQRERCEIKQLR